MRGARRSLSRAVGSRTPFDRPTDANDVSGRIARFATRLDAFVARACADVGPASARLVFPALYLCTRVFLYRFQSIWSTFHESDVCVDIEANTHESSLE